ncbi:MAG: hypothetical protein GY754_10355 [bacterium]|nr:hypothetical protein [bacterium]
MKVSRTVLRGERGCKASALLGDLRKLLKKSVSAVTAYAVEEYLDIILGLVPEDPEKSDKYLVRHYVISSSEMHGVISWQLFWGLPEKTADLLQCRLI